MSTTPVVEEPEIVAELMVPGATQIHGVTFDGSLVWCAASPGDVLHAVDPATGREAKKLGLDRCASGTAFDGEHLWQIRGETIDRVDRATGMVLRSIPAPPGGHHSGLAFAAGALWVGDFDGRAIRKVDPANGKVLRTVKSDRLVTGVTFVGADLWHGTYADEGSTETDDIRAIDPETGAVRRRVRLPAGMHVSGTEFDGKDRIWFGSELGGKASLRAVTVKKRQSPKV